MAEQHGTSRCKENVQCFYCDHTSRRDNLNYHFQTCHKGKQVKCKEILLPGQLSLHQFTKQPSKQTEPTDKPPDESSSESDEYGDNAEEDMDDQPQGHSEFGGHVEDTLPLQVRTPVKKGLILHQILWT